MGTTSRPQRNLVVLHVPSAVPMLIPEAASVLLDLLRELSDASEQQVEANDSIGSCPDG
jgi:hypothetical protein